jgi:hypothetical protein
MLPSNYAGPYSRSLFVFVLYFFSRSYETAAVRCHPTRRTRMPASHAGVADVPSTLDQLSAMAWINVIIESRHSRRQTIHRTINRLQNVVATVKRKVLRGSRSRKLGAY